MTSWLAISLQPLSFALACLVQSHEADIGTAINIVLSVCEMLIIVRLCLNRPTRRSMGTARGTTTDWQRLPPPKKVSGWSAVSSGLAFGEVSFWYVLNKMSWTLHHAIISSLALHRNGTKTHDLGNLPCVLRAVWTQMADGAKASYQRCVCVTQLTLKKEFLTVQQTYGWKDWSGMVVSN